MPGSLTLLFQLILYPDRVGGICRYSAGTLTGVHGMQVLCRHPDRFQGHAGTLTDV